MTSDSRGAGGTVETITVAGQPAFSLRNSVGDQLVVLQHGAQVLSWMTADGIERMYCTPRLPSTPKPVRGGVPVIFPQFNLPGPRRHAGHWRQTRHPAAPMAGGGQSHGAAG